MQVIGNTIQEQYLWYITLKGVIDKYGKNPPADIIQMVKDEMDTITSNDFTDYILIVWDIHNFCRTPERVREFCKSKGIEAPPDGIIPIGPGRGSVGGSIVCYVIGIHECDPVRFGLFFERFLNPERVAYPDIDFDISQKYRHIVLEYIADTYGHEYVAQIITYSTLSAKSVIEEVLKSARVPLGEIKKVKETVPSDPEITIADMKKNEKFMQAMMALTFPDVKFKIDASNVDKLLQSPYYHEKMSQEDRIVCDMIKNGKRKEHDIIIKSTWDYKKAIDIMERLEKLKKHESVHSGGVVIAPIPLEGNIPLMKKKGEGHIATQYDMKDLESLGYLKMDALGLRTVDVNHDAEAMVRKWFDPNFDIRKIPYDDRQAIDIISTGDTVGIFQVESSGFTQMMIDIFNAAQHINISQYEDEEIVYFMLIAMGMALYRPGPLDAEVDGKTMVQHLIDRMAGKDPIIYMFPEEEKYLKETYGILVYQEQVMARVRQMTGCTYGRADMLRRAMGKKDPVEMQKQMDWFREHAMKHKFTDKLLVDENHKKQIVDRAIEQIRTFARYGFNKSHAVEYAHICYRNAYLKAHYPAAFFTALLNSEIGNSKRQSIIISDMIKHDIQLLPPLVSTSDRHFTMTATDTVRFGLEAISGLGDKATQFIMQDKENNGPYQTIEEFRARVPGGLCNVNAMTNLAKCGAFDDMLDKCKHPIKNRASLVATIKDINDAINKLGRKKGKNKPKPTTKQVLDNIQSTTRLYTVTEMEEDLIEYATWEKEVLKFFISAHPMDAYRDEIRRWTALGDVELEDLPHEFYLAGYITGSHETTVKKEGRNKGKKMGFVSFDTEFASYDITVFPGIWDTFVPYLKCTEPVIIKCTRGSYKGQISIQGQYVRHMKNEGIRDCPEVHIKLNNVDYARMIYLSSMFREHPGITQVIFHVRSGHQLISIQTDKMVSLNDRILEFCEDIGEVSYKPF